MKKLIVLSFALACIAFYSLSSVGVISACGSCSCGTHCSATGSNACCGCGTSTSQCKTCQADQNCSSGGGGANGTATCS